MTKRISRERPVETLESMLSEDSSLSEIQGVQGTSLKNLFILQTFTSFLQNLIQREVPGGVIRKKTYYASIIREAVEMSLEVGKCYDSVTKPAIQDFEDESL